MENKVNLKIKAEIGSIIEVNYDTSMTEGEFLNQYLELARVNTCLFLCKKYL
jgi:hypothetical protein